MGNKNTKPLKLPLTPITFFELAVFLPLLRKSWEEYKHLTPDGEPCNAHHTMYWAIREWDDQNDTEREEEIDGTPVDMFWDEKALPKYLDLVLNPQFHSSVYKVLLELYPENTYIAQLLKQHEHQTGTADKTATIL